MARYWYVYDGTGSDVIPSNYILPQAAPFNCNGGTVTCQIFAPAGGANPVPAAFTPNLLGYITVAKANKYPLYPFPPDDPYVGSRTP